MATLLPLLLLLHLPLLVPERIKPRLVVLPSFRCLCGEMVFQTWLSYCNFSVETCSTLLYPRAQTYLPFHLRRLVPRSFLGLRVCQPSYTMVGIEVGGLGAGLGAEGTARQIPRPRRSAESAPRGCQGITTACADRVVWCCRPAARGWSVTRAFPRGGRA